MQDFSQNMRKHSTNWILLLLSAAVFAPAIIWLYQRWTLSIWHNGHGIFIPFIVAFIIRDLWRRETRTALPVDSDQETSSLGFLLVVPGLLILIMDTAIKTQLLSAAGLLVCLPGYSLLLLGARRTKALSFAWILTFFMLPIPSAFVSSLQFWLRSIAANGAEWIVSTAGIPVLRADSTLHLADNTLVIADACSGFSTLYAGVTFALILAYLSSSTARRALLIAFSWPLAIGFNVLRCAALALLVHHWGIDILKTSWHEISGFLSFGSVLATLLLLSHSNMASRRPA